MVSKTILASVVVCIVLAGCGASAPDVASPATTPAATGAADATTSPPTVTDSSADGATASPPAPNAPTTAPPAEPPSSLPAAAEIRRRTTDPRFDSYAADVVQTHRTAGDQVTESRYRVTRRRVNGSTLSRREYTSPATRSGDALVVDATGETHYDASSNVVVRRDRPSLEPDPRRLLDGDYLRVVDVRGTTTAGRPAYAVDLVPRDDRAYLDRRTVWVDADRWVVLGYEDHQTVDGTAHSTTRVATSVRYGVDPPRDAFSLDVPDDAHEFSHPAPLATYRTWPALADATVLDLPRPTVPGAFAWGGGSVLPASDERPDGSVAMTFLRHGLPGIDSFLAIRATPNGSLPSDGERVTVDGHPAVYVEDRSSARYYVRDGDVVYRVWAHAYDETFDREDHRRVAASLV
jgi:outer membrane lipoprotein-sorting protein